MIIEKLNEYRQSMDEHNEKFNKELENIKETQTVKYMIEKNGSVD